MNKVKQYSFLDILKILGFFKTNEAMLLTSLKTQKK